MKGKKYTKYILRHGNKDEYGISYDEEQYFIKRLLAMAKENGERMHGGKKEEPKRRNYCEKIGGDCKYMMNGECYASVCKRVDTREKKC